MNHAIHLGPRQLYPAFGKPGNQVSAVVHAVSGHELGQVARMIDAIVDAAEDWPDKCGEIGFDDRQTTLLAQMLRRRIDSLR